jgi:pSer/pThr/pTyr-binding forkhead associated (FHA) protein
MRASLTVVSGPLARQSIEVSHGKLLIGREPDCHLRPDSPLISRHHCVLLLDDYTLRIRDLASKNGTFVNSRRVGTSETILSHGDIVALGDMVCQVSVSSAATEVEPVPPVAQPTASPSSLEGTGVFEGDTVQDEYSGVVSPRQDVPAPTPDLPSALPASPDDVGRTV